MSDKRNFQVGGAFSRRRFIQVSAAAVTGLAAGSLRLPVVRAEALDWFAVLQDDDVVDVTGAAFGAVGDGSTDDRAAFQAAIDEAIATGKPLLLPQPAQFYRIVLDTEHEHLLVDGDLTIIGADRTTTLIRFSLSSPDVSKFYAGFYITNGSNVQMTDLRLEEDFQPAEPLEFAGVFMPSGPEDHSVVVESVDIDGFSHCLYSPSGGTDLSGELFLTVNRCDLSAYWRYSIAFWAPETGHKRLHIYDSYLHDNQDSHLVYCHPHISIHVENTRFDGAAAWAFQIQGSAVGGDPDYQRFIGCWFGPRNGRGIITQDREATKIRVEIRNCIFEGRPAVQIRGDILIDGCYFTTPVNPPSGTNFISAYSNAPWVAVISNCVFSPRANSLPDIDLRLENIEASVLNCQFYSQGSGNVIALGRSNNNVYTIADCLFYTRQDNDAQTVALDIENGGVTVDRCRFVGRVTGNRGMVTLRDSETGPGPSARLQIDNCLFQNISGGTAFHVVEDYGNSWSSRIFGRNNRFSNMLTNDPMLTLSPANITVNGQLEPVSGLQPSPVSAAPLMTLVSNYDTFQVIGSANVETIHWWTDDGRSDPLFSGFVNLVANNGLTLVEGGNIDLGGAGQRVVQPGEQVRLLYESFRRQWREMPTS